MNRFCLLALNKEKGKKNQRQGKWKKKWNKIESEIESEKGVKRFGWMTSWRESDKIKQKKSSFRFHWF